MKFSLFYSHSLISILFRARSLGAEYAMASDQRDHGEFSPSLINALENSDEADTNKYGRQSTEEQLQRVPVQGKMVGEVQVSTYQLAEKIKSWNIHERVSVPIQKNPVTAPVGMLQWVDYFKQTSSLNDLSYMSDSYEAQVTNLKTGRTMPINELIAEGYAYVKRWVQREFLVLDYKIKGNRVEIRSKYSCTNEKGKTVSGFCKTTWIISPNGKIQAIADDTSTHNLPVFSFEVSASDAHQSKNRESLISTEAHGMGCLTKDTAYKWARRLQQAYPINDLSYMRNYYAPSVTELKTGRTMSLDELILLQRRFISRWGLRSCIPRDFAWGDNRVEVRFRYSCTNTLGRTVQGYCKATWQISRNGRVEAYDDDSSTSAWPAFSAKVGTPQPYHW